MVRNGDPVVVALRPASNKLGVAVSMKENVINPALAKVFHPFLNVMTIQCVQIGLEWARDSECSGLVQFSDVAQLESPA
jgi:hypothetical protein